MRADKLTARATDHPARGNVSGGQDPIESIKGNTLRESIKEFGSSIHILDMKSNLGGKSIRGGQIRGRCTHIYRIGPIVGILHGRYTTKQSRGEMKYMTLQRA